MNRIMLIGRLTKDPELKYTPSGVPVATFGLAVDRRFKNAQGEREADFFNVVAWRQQAELLSQYATKGRRIGLEGRVQIRNYVGQDGVKRYITEVVLDSVDLLDSPRDAGAGGPAGAPGPQDSGAPPAPEIDEFADPFSEA